MTTHYDTPITNEVIANLVTLRDRMIAAGPDHFEMQNFGIYTYHDDYEGDCEMTLSLGDVNPSLTTRCGYAACIAGWAAVLEMGDTVETIAAQLGMFRPRWNWNPVTEQQDCQLISTDAWFYVDSWPDWAKLRRMNLLYDGEHNRQQAEHQVVIEVLDDLIHGRRSDWFDDDTTAIDTVDLIDAEFEERNSHDHDA